MCRSGCIAFLEETVFVHTFHCMALYYFPVFCVKRGIPKGKNWVNGISRSFHPSHINVGNADIKLFYNFSPNPGPNEADIGSCHQMRAA